MSLAGSGTAPTASHSDHDHIGAAWTGSGGLTINNTNPSGVAFWGIGPQWGVQGNSSSSGPNTGGVVGVTSNAGGNGVLGDGGPGTGVKGHSTGNNGVYGTTSSTTASGVYGENTSSSGYRRRGAGRVRIRRFSPKSPAPPASASKRTPPAARPRFTLTISPAGRPRGSKGTRS